MNAIVQRAICDARLLFDFDYRVHRKRREFDEISNRLQKVYSKIIVDTIVEIHLLISKKRQSFFLILFDRVSYSNVAMLLKTMSFHVIDEQRHIIAFEIHRANELIVVNFQFRYELIQIKNEIQRRCVEKNEMSKHLIFDDVDLKFEQLMLSLQMIVYVEKFYDMLTLRAKKHSSLKTNDKILIYVSII